MPTPVLMPALSPTMTEGTLAKWLKKEGDMVKSGDVIAEIETDKATMEVESADEGRLGKILVPAGTAGVKVNAAIAVLIDKNEKVGDIIVPSPSQGGNTIPLSPSQGEGTRIPSSSQGEGTRIPFPPEGEGARIPSPFQGKGRVGDKNVSAPTPLSAPSLSGGGGHVALGSSSSTARITASPLAKRVANERGVDLRTITGTGPRGRIIKADVMGATPHPNPLATSGERGQTARASSADARALADAYGMTYTAQPNSSVRKVIAARLSESKQTIPHFYLTTDCVIDKLLDARAHLNDRAKGAYKLSVNDFIIRAAALALRDFPAANVAWTDAATLQFDHADISVAVATPNGLITPIVKAAETKSIVQISAEIKDLAARARDGALKPTEFQGGTFTISNLGMYGISEFSAIINPPQACILAVGAGVQQPVVEGGAVVVRTVMKVTLSVDHRAVDGAVGAEFLQILKQYIENPVGMLV